MGMFSRNTPAVSLIKMILIPFFVDSQRLRVIVCLLIFLKYFLICDRCKKIVSNFVSCFWNK